jgi:hypothetical protein
VAEWPAFVVLELALWAGCAVHLSSILLEGVWQAAEALQLAWLALVLAWGALKLDAALGVVAWLREIFA